MQPGEFDKEVHVSRNENKIVVKSSLMINKIKQSGKLEKIKKRYQRMALEKFNVTQKGLEMAWQHQTSETLFLVLYKKFIYIIMSRVENDSFAPRSLISFYEIIGFCMLVKNRIDIVS